MNNTEVIRNLDPATYSGITDVRIFLNKPEIKALRGER